MKSSDSSTHVIRATARKHWQIWGRTTASHVLQGAGTAVGAALVSFIVWWAQRG
ncbi:hypothetical protein ACIBL8_06505 [Streptomyces sp. NPDC050523]|uniref:hypothetical protein n=1 Tax=Streptomyces sp. NPDC050523 TaxID=3365622 RepID=UPI0037883A88